MENAAKQYLHHQITDSESQLISSLRSVSGQSLYESFALRGIRVDRVEPGLVSCTFKIPPRLTDRTGKLASSAIANLVDEVGAAVVQIEGLPMNVSVDMSISFLSNNTKVNDELEIVSTVLRQKGGYYGTIVLVKNKNKRDGNERENRDNFLQYFWMK